MKKIISLILSICLLSLLLEGCKQEEVKKEKKPVLVKSYTIQQKQGHVNRRFPGKVSATKEVNLSFKVRGQIVQLPIHEGMAIEKDGLIAKLDDHRFRERANESKAIYIRDKAQYARAAALVKDGHISQMEYDHKRSNYLTAKSTYSRALKDLKDTSLRAPFRGHISKRYVDNYEYVQVKQKVARLQDLTMIDVAINVPENVMISIKRDGKEDDVYVFFPTYPDKKYSVKLKEISAQADPETQTYRIKLKMPAPKDINVLPGMTAVIVAKLPDRSDSAEGYVTIPSGAVFSDKQGKPSVWVIDSKTMKVNLRNIEVGKLSGNSIQVRQGLKPGDKIVAAGANFLRQGEEVNPIPNKKINE